MIDAAFVAKQQELYTFAGNCDLKALHDEVRRDLVDVFTSPSPDIPQTSLDELTAKLRLIRQEARSRGINPSRW